MASVRIYLENGKWKMETVDNERENGVKENEAMKEKESYIGLKCKKTRRWCLKA